MISVIIGICCFIAGGIFGLTFSCIFHVSHDSDNYQYNEKGLDNSEQETRSIVEE